MMVKERPSGTMWWAVFAGDFVSAVLYRRFVLAVSGEEILYGGFVWRFGEGILYSGYGLGPGQRPQGNM